jgi:hypothetical protein
MSSEYIDVCTANKYKNSIYDCKVELKKIFFIFYFKKAGDDGAFERAAKTRNNELSNSDKYSKEKGDLILLWPVTSAEEFKKKWENVSNLQKNSLYRVEEAHLYTHASLGERIDGLEFSPSFTNTGALSEDGTVSHEELEALPKILWTKNSKIVLYGCNTGNTSSVYGKKKSVATVLHDAQKPLQTLAQDGYAYFSTDKNKYIRAIGTPDKLYLWAYKRGKNSLVGNGDALAPIVVK